MKTFAETHLKCLRKAPSCSECLLYGLAKKSLLSPAHSDSGQLGGLFLFSYYAKHFSVN